MYSILTCADTNFYPMALCLARNIRHYPGYKLFLYDLGLQDTEREKLRELDVTIEQIHRCRNLSCGKGDRGHISL